ncbi:hypothetical protein TNCT_656631 [Trichonephila clavata]|uniref:Uncharacterized protein n=1 Tax=Trichonephila clavata TaxID=2740835 RepID=A0A8X6ICJ3_TRICU|nr:hypothetical protein TNCT_656631 [Trichonephila clavata]
MQKYLFRVTLFPEDATFGIEIPVCKSKEVTSLRYQMYKLLLNNILFTRFASFHMSIVIHFKEEIVENLSTYIVSNTFL